MAELIGEISVSDAASGLGWMVIGKATVGSEINLLMRRVLYEAGEDGLSEAKADILKQAKELPDG